MPSPKKIARLPAEIRAWLEKAIVKRGFGDIVALTSELNDLCKAGGVAISIGKSAVGIESQRIRRAQEAIRATTEAARLIAETSPDDADDRSAAAMALVQSEMFDMLLKIRECDSEDDPVVRMGVMNDAALGLSRLSRSRVNQARWATDVAEVFVCGDMGRGQSLIVWAIAEGRSCAAAVDAHLMGHTDLPSPLTPDDRPLV